LKKYLDPDADIVNDRVFESAVGKEFSETFPEK
jgi:hypothetical protein